MAKFYGRQAAIGLKLGDTPDSDTPDTYVPWTEVGFDDTSDQIQNESSFGSITHFNDQVTTRITGEGDITTKMWYKNLYYFMCLAFGQRPTKTENEDGSFQYDFALSNSNEHLTADVFIKDPIEQRKFPSAMLNTLGLTWSLTEFTTMAANFISKASQPTTGLTPAFDASDHEFKPNSLIFKLAQTVAELEAAPLAAGVTSANLTITKNATGVQTVASGTDYESVHNGDFEVSLEIEKTKEDTTYKEMAYNDTPQAVIYGFEDAINKAGTDTNTSLTFTLPKVMMASYESPYALADLATESFTGNGMLDLASSTIITARLVVSEDYDEPTPAP